MGYAWGMTDFRRVLVTGAAGAVGRPVCEELRGRGHWVRGLDLRGADHVDEMMLGDIADEGVAEGAMRGLGAVVHLAAYPHAEGDFMEDLLRPNVVGLHRLLTAAADSYEAGGVSRLVLASSMQVVSGVKRERGDEGGGGGGVLSVEVAAPRNHYALTKRWAEVYGEMVSQTRGLPVLSVRIGWLTRDAGEAERLRAMGKFAYFLSHRDAGRFFSAAVEVEGTVEEWKGGVVYGVSRPPGGVPPPVDMEAARRLIGYEAGDVFPEGLPFEV